MKKPILIIAGVGVATAIAWYFYNRSKQPAVVAAQPVQKAVDVAQQVQQFSNNITAPKPTVVVPTRVTAPVAQIVKENPTVQQVVRTIAPSITVTPKVIAPAPYVQDQPTYTQAYPIYSRDFRATVEGLGEPRLR